MTDFDEVVLDPAEMELARTRRLYASTDAQVWAAEWCNIAREISGADDGRQVIDEGWMVGWFANAMETARAAGYREGRDGVLTDLRVWLGSNGG